MEQEKQDQLIQDLINYLIEHKYTFVDEYIKKIDLTQPQWDEIRIIALDKDFITENGGVHCYNITRKGLRYGGDRYIREIQKERAENELKSIRDAERERKEVEKLDTDLTLAKWQKKTFWWVFLLGGVGGICGIISLSIQIAEYLNSR